ncbi:hypothetical protein DL95DRAFT_401928 [Leptodontidium sp. 2 PMI_412]|nr:hypothetical protein DL95DRAFT_401928 [Leptodontidium sp. 2 PMI_412]
MATSTLSLRPGAKEYNIAFDGNPKPSTHPWADCWDFTCLNGVPPFIKMRVSSQAMAFVRVDDGKRLPATEDAVDDDKVKVVGEAEGVAEEVQENKEESISRMRRAEKGKDVDWDVHPNYDRWGRVGRLNEMKVNGDGGLEGTKGDPEQAGVKAWIKNVWSAWS